MGMQACMYMSHVSSVGSSLRTNQGRNHPTQAHLHVHACILHVHVYESSECTRTKGGATNLHVHVAYNENTCTTIFPMSAYIFNWFKVEVGFVNLRGNVEHEVLS